MKQHEITWANAPLRELLRLAWPIAVSMISYSTMTLVDTFFVGLIGPSALAGAGMGGITTWTLVCFPFGLLMGAKILVSQDVGEGEADRSGYHLGAALIMAVIWGAVTIAVGKMLSPIIPLISATTEAAEAGDTYFNIRLLSTPALLVFSAVREVRQGLGDSRTPMIASVVANVINMVLDYIFIIKLDCGVAGAAWASVIAGFVEAAAIIGVHARTGFKVLGTRWRHVVALWRIGWPTGVQFVVEMGCFTILSAMISYYSETHMAAHQVAVQVLHMSFLPAVAIGEGVSVLVGQAVGAGRLTLVKIVSRLGMKAAGSYTALWTVGLIFFAGDVAGAFSDDPVLIDVTTRLFYVAAVFQLADGANIIARGALRGTGDVRYPAVIGTAIAWLVTPPSMLVLGYWMDLGALGGWIGFSAELFFCAGIFWWRLERGGWKAASAKTGDIRRQAAGYSGGVHP